MSKNGVISGPHFPVFELNSEKYGPEITPYLDSILRGDYFCLLQPKLLKVSKEDHRTIYQRFLKLTLKERQ